MLWHSRARRAGTINKEMLKNQRTTNSSGMISFILSARFRARASLRGDRVFQAVVLTPLCKGAIS
jgi:hypothetical protein